MRAGPADAHAFASIHCKKPARKCTTALCPHTDDEGTTSRAGSLRQGPAPADQLGLQLRSRRSDRSPPTRMFECEQIPIEGIADGCACFGAHQCARQVIPGPVRVTGAVEVAVDDTGGDEAEVERGGSERTELSPTQIAGRIARQSDHRAPQLSTAARPEAHIATKCSSPPGGTVRLTRRLIDDERHPRALGVDCTEAGGEPRDAVSGVGRAVERIYHDQNIRVGVMEAALLAEYTDRRIGQHTQSRLVGHEVTSVLSGPGSCETPVVEVPQGRGHRSRHLAEQLQQISVSETAHQTSSSGGQTVGTNESTAAHAIVGTPGRRPRLAVIDVAGFIADLKDHAADHGFHVHDERHFVESYSLRQAWEVDLHPDEACGGPLDLHLALEIDPRSLLGFEDLMLDLAEGADPPTGYTFPLIFTWTLPPLPNPPDLLVIATDIAGIGGTDLPTEVSAVDSFAMVTDASQRSLTTVARIELGLDQLFLGQENLCDALDRCHAVSTYLLERAPEWLNEG